MSGDPYVYPGTNVLLNTLNIRDNDVLRAFEVEASGQRMIQPTPPIKMAAEGYQQLHKHIFQDVYPWAGQIRTCTLAKGGDEFCRPQFIESEMGKRFALVQAGATQMKQSPDAFAREAAIHISELNAIHPFREGNGRTNRAFLKALAKEHGHEADLRKIKPADWISASRANFKEPTDTTQFEAIIKGCLVIDRPNETSLAPHAKGRGFSR